MFIFLPLAINLAVSTFLENGMQDATITPRVKLTEWTTIEKVVISKKFGIKILIKKIIESFREYQQFFLLK